MIKLIAIGKNKDKALQSLEKEYMKRLSAFCKFSEIEVKDEANEHISREAEVLLVKEKEGNRVLENRIGCISCAQKAFIMLRQKKWNIVVFFLKDIMINHMVKVSFLY